MNTLSNPAITTKSRWMGRHAEGFIWPLWLMVVFHLGEARWLHTDSAYTLFRILNQQSLFYDRFACELIVWPGQLLTLLGAPAIWVLQGLNLILPLMGWVLWVAFAHNPHRWVLFFLILAGGNELFFIGYSEIGLSTLSFLTSWLLLVGIDWNRQNRWQLPALALALLITLLSHPAGWLYVIVFAAFALAILHRKTLLALGFTLLIAMGLKTLIFPSNTYDSGLYRMLFTAETWQHFGQLWSLNYLTHASWFFIPGVTAVACLLLGLTKPWRWYSLAFFSIWLIEAMVCVIVYSQGDAHINMEKFFYPMSVLAMLSIPMYLWASHLPQFGEYRLKFVSAKQRELSRSIVGILPWFMSVSTLLGIQQHSPTYTNRYQQLHALITAMPNEKMIAHYDSLSSRVHPGSLWGLSYETALTSVLNQERTGHSGPVKSMKAMSTEEIADWDETQKRIGDSLLIGAPFEMPQRIDRLNRRYFKFEQGTTYQLWNPATNRN
jgi:hypothetical protein